MSAEPQTARVLCATCQAVGDLLHDDGWRMFDKKTYCSAVCQRGGMASSQGAETTPPTFPSPFFNDDEGGK